MAILAPFSAQQQKKDKNEKTSLPQFPENDPHIRTNLLLVEPFNHSPTVSFVVTYYKHVRLCPGCANNTGKESWSGMGNRIPYQA
jgi:hypothetical protein